MVAAKGAIISLLKDAYIKRDRAGLVTFRKDRANLPSLPQLRVLSLQKNSLSSFRPVEERHYLTEFLKDMNF